MLAREALKVSYTRKAIATAVGCIAELGGKYLLLKALHTSDSEFRKIKIGLNWKFPPCWLTLIVPESPLWAVGGELPSTVLLAI